MCHMFVLSGVIGRDVAVVLMVLLHVWCCRGMQMKSEEPHFELGVGHPNDLEHTYT